MALSTNVDTIEFFDEESNDSACVIVRRWGDKIGLCVSLRSDGDIEIFLDGNSAARLVRAIAEALNGKA